jgi:tRNA-dihydrouridine synthase A
MMDWTDRHCRYFLRGFSPDVLLYTEMITAAAILRGNRERLLAYDAAEHPVALQLGGSEPEDLATAARIGAQFGYDEINLNCGCPSDRVHSGAFGACLMLQPALVAECVAAMRSAVSLPVTVKLRIGVVAGQGGLAARQAVAQCTEADVEALLGFVSAVSTAGAAAVIVHARKAVLGGLSPKENREVPPLRYDVVRIVKERFPKLSVILNGGLRQVDPIREALSWCDGVMLGREAYHHPWLLVELNAALGARLGQLPDRALLLERMAAYAERELARGERLPSITRHMLGLYAGEPGAREYRRRLSDGARDPAAGAHLLRQAAPEAAK